MFFRRKPEEKRQKRHVYGFLCSDGVKITVKFMARQLIIPTYCLVEHLLETSLVRLELEMRDPAFSEKLRQHLIVSHLLQAEAVPNDYDTLIARKERRQERLRRQYEEDVRHLVDVFEENGLSVRQVGLLIQGWLAWKRRKAKAENMSTEPGEDRS